MCDVCMNHGWHAQECHHCLNDKIEHLEQRIKKLEQIIWSSAHILCGVKQIMEADDD
jgi:hypothetical protein